ncbi:hypothetical protein [Bradyrhizobium sp. sGM-13]|uniref:hypothetical protein n=1 Tax=Bradyrhizobium sp. sGM-13 TaxID=2831781 RepID=UPI001BCE9BB1|nr:hypothetical protein [Bradyrhizobium sp. sGM-13]
MEFPLRTIRPDLARAKLFQCHSRQAIAHGSTASFDGNEMAQFDGQMTVLAVICAKTLSFLGFNAGS